MLITLFGENKNRRQGEPKLSKSYLNTYIFRTIGRFQKIDYQKAAFWKYFEKYRHFRTNEAGPFRFYNNYFPFQGRSKVIFKKNYLEILMRVKLSSNLATD